MFTTDCSTFVMIVFLYTSKLIFLTDLWFMSLPTAAPLSASNSVPDITSVLFELFDGYFSNLRKCFDNDPVVCKKLLTYTWNTHIHTNQPLLVYQTISGICYLLLITPLTRQLQLQLICGVQWTEDPLVPVAEPGMSQDIDLNSFSHVGAASPELYGFFCASSLRH